MQPAPSDPARPPASDQGGGAWQWDETDDRSSAPADVLSGGAEDDGGPRPTRRRLLAGAGLLAAGAAAWAFARSAGGPDPAPPRPLPTRLAGPEPLWTYRGREPMAPERLNGRPAVPVLLSREGLQVLDPATGKPLRMLTFAAVRANWPDDVDQPGTRVVVGADRVFTTSNGHVDSHHLTDPASEWSLPLPEESGSGTVTLFGCAGDVVYGAVQPRPYAGGDRLFAVHVPERRLLWTRAALGGERPLTPVTSAGGRVPVFDNSADGAHLALLEAATGKRLWAVPAEAGLTWAVADAEHVYAPEGPAGLRALRLADGAPHWSVRPGPADEWRLLPPVTGGPRVYLFRDNGLVTAHDVTTGDRLWERHLPFRLDRRSHPLLAGPALYVPGPAAAGVCALDAATGEERWTFRDSGPGVDVWSLSNDPTRLYAGHDDVLHALPLV
ncbi:PQQ-binding-like beta-propeller repeat protein [Kitasatospora sp. NPDC050463]|uniref:outer membrane protein assembly factor BamB family protein n=1 Tax=Kitasatospora sp. NPDC050463 TaxID=3155786 RepID=UPI0033DE0E92